MDYNLAMTHNVTPVILVLIISGYLMIAWQFRSLWVSLKGNQKARHALAYLIAIFMLCSFCGYFSHFLPKSYELIINIAHIILAFFTWVYIFTNQASIVLRLLKDCRCENGDP